MPKNDAIASKKLLLKEMYLFDPLSLSTYQNLNRIKINL